MRTHSTGGGSFQAVRDLFWQQDSGERREGPRHPYECKQLLAPYDGVTLPSQKDFLWVECRNLSSRGMAFLLPGPPDFKNVVVALGVAPFIFLLARVVYFDVEGRNYLCGCRFHRRINRMVGNDAVETRQLRAELNRALLELTVKEAAVAAKS